MPAKISLAFARFDLARGIAKGSPLVVAGNYRTYASQPSLMAGWANRWRMNGASPKEQQSKMNKILQGAEPPQSEDAVFALLAAVGFENPTRFFASLFWGAWIARLGPAVK